MSTIEKILSVAKAEIGVTELPANSNNVKYNTWFYGQEVYDGLWNTTFAWCMAFVQWVYTQAGVPLPYKTASCNGLLNWYKANQSECVTSSPQRGDIVIYNFSHTGIVESVASATITAIEGNTSSTDAGSQSNGGGVFRRVRKKSLVTAYIRPHSNLVSDEPTVAAVNYQAKVTASSLNCRSTYSTSGSIVTSYPKGTIITITQECYDWGYTGVGWVSLQYVSKIETTAKEDDDMMTGEQIYKALQEYLATCKTSSGIQAELDEAVKAGITDGSNPTQYVTRAQAAVMAKRAYEKAKQ